MAPRCFSPALLAFTPLTRFQYVPEAAGKKISWSHLGAESLPSGFAAALLSFLTWESKSQKTPEMVRASRKGQAMAAEARFVKTFLLPCCYLQHCILLGLAQKGVAQELSPWYIMLRMDEILSRTMIFPLLLPTRVGCGRKSGKNILLDAMVLGHCWGSLGTVCADVEEVWLSPSISHAFGRQ